MNPRLSHSNSRPAIFARQLLFRTAQFGAVGILPVLAATGCAASDGAALSASLDRYAELSSRNMTANWPVEFGEVLAGDALAAAEAGFLLLAESGFSQVGSIGFDELEIVSPGEATACLDLSDSRVVHESGAALAGRPSERVELGYQRLGGALKISRFDLVGESC